MRGQGRHVGFQGFNPAEKTLLARSSRDPLQRCPLLGFGQKGVMLETDSREYLVEFTWFMYTVPLSRSQWHKSPTGRGMISEKKRTNRRGIYINGHKLTAVTNILLREILAIAVCYLMISGKIDGTLGAVGMLKISYMYREEEGRTPGITACSLAGWKTLPKCELTGKKYSKRDVTHILKPQRSMKERVRRLVHGLLDRKPQEHLLLCRYSVNTAKATALPRRQHPPSEVRTPPHRRQLNIHPYKTRGGKKSGLFTPLLTRVAPFSCFLYTYILRI